MNDFNLPEDACEQCGRTPPDKWRKATESTTNTPILCSSDCYTSYHDEVDSCFVAEFQGVWTIFVVERP